MQEINLLACPNCFCEYERYAEIGEAWDGVTYEPTCDHFPNNALIIVG